MQTCFMIQPFDNGKYDKRFEDIYKPAIVAAGFEPYRVDYDASVLVPIDAIEKGISEAAMCLADISLDNPNVWYELGYAFASKRPVIMVCSDERAGKKYPFDIQHRTIIPYTAEAPSDFMKLQEAITTRMRATADRADMLDQIATSAPATSIDGLSAVDMAVIAVIAGDVSHPAGAVVLHGAKSDAERAGITGLGFNIAMRKLENRGFITSQDVHDEMGESYAGISITPKGWRWIELNESQFVLRHQP
jgi:hypothetical protein